MLSQVVPIAEEDEGPDQEADEVMRQYLEAEESAARKEALPPDMGQGHQATQQLPGGYAPPAPMGGRPVWAAYYFTILDATGAEVTVSREVMIPADAIVECRGNSLVIHHEGVADTFRIGRVRPA